MSEYNVYSDFDVQFRINPITKDVIVKTDAESVRQSLRLLLQTIFYDRKWQPAIGTNLNDLLFGQLDDIQLFSVEQELKEIIYKYEPRVNIENLTCEVGQSNEVHVIITIVYKILYLNTTDTFTYEVNKIR